MNVRKLKLPDILCVILTVCIIAGTACYAVLEQCVEIVRDASAATTVDVYCLSSGPFHLGDEVNMYAKVNHAHSEYQMTWQYNDGTGWKDTDCHGSVYTYILDSKNAACSYRAVVTTGGNEKDTPPNTDTLVLRTATEKENPRETGNAQRPVLEYSSVISQVTKAFQAEEAS